MQALKESLAYLSSEAALRSLERDAYWPKWDSPWWHMCLLHEMGMTRRIPGPAVEKLLECLEATPGTGFLDGSDAHCHCALGTIYQVLSGFGADVEGRLPWIRDWFLRYQMADGGFNCDANAYQVEGECPSSMVGTIAPFEAVLFYTPRDWTGAELEFLDRCAEFLLYRQLYMGSETVANAEERVQAEAWMQLCFPRFYFYDVLRGLRALLHWADRRKRQVAGIRVVWERLQRGVEIGRRPWAGARTRLPEGGRAEASRFALLDQVSADGPSAYLERQWRECQELGARWLR
jgi:hypothetical protein